jgi:hypothetical protein
MRDSPTLNPGRSFLGLLEMDDSTQSQQTLFWVFRNDPYLSKLSEAEAGLELMLKRLEVSPYYSGIVLANSGF